jgi:broad specificity phosphatase PhoE
MTTIMLIRHGETDWNVEEVFRGRADIELNEAGVKQAQLLARFLEGVPMEAVYSSPLKRALRTAEIVAAPHGLDVIATQELVDFHFGAWQGMSHDAVRDEFKALYYEWLKNPHRVRILGGETLDEVKRRAGRLINEVIATNAGTVALVSHRVIHKVIICSLLGLDNSHFWDIELDTCGVTTFVHVDGRFILKKHNDTSFLRSMNRRAQTDF